MLKYIKGDATDPQGEGDKLIVHCCNDEGGWGSGFVLAISKRWDKPEKAYREWYRTGLYPYDFTFGLDKFALGQIQCVPVTDDIMVVNLIGQHKTIKTNKKPIDYKAIESGLDKVRCYCEEYTRFWNKDISVHMPKIGSGLAKGDWNTIEKIVIKTLSSKGIDVTVYEY
jgi:O-acetyl-ADP-ribose deacetylase (regulator of RNase III)